MKTIRRGTFETNSSSTHSITMCIKSDYDRFIKGEILLGDAWWIPKEERKQFYTKEEAINLIKKYNKYIPNNMDWDNSEQVNELLRDADFQDSDYCNEYLESYYEEFTTPNGEVIVAFGEYGYNG